MKILVLCILATLCSFDARAGVRGQDLYEALPSSEFNVTFINARTGNPRLGIQTKEKSVEGIFCRKTSPVVPNPQISYECFVAMNYTAVQMHRFYDGLRTTEERLGITDDQGHIPIDGPVIFEKSAATYLCQKRTFIVGPLPPRYLCLRNLENIK